MKILVLSTETPLPANSGSRVRTLNLARQLAKSFDVEVAALGDAETAAAEPFALRHVPHSRHRRQALAHSLGQPYLAALSHSRRLKDFALAKRWDTVQATLPWTVPAARCAGVPIVLDAHNLEADVARTTGATESRTVYALRWRWEASKIERYERRILRTVDAVCATSDADAEKLETWGARECIVVPNGVDTTTVRHQTPASEPVVLYTAHFGYRPNILAATELIDDVLPRLGELVPGASLRLVGKGAGPALRSRARPGVEFTGEVKDLLAQLHGARVMVVPLRAGSGTRLKVLEAMSAGLPVVSTRFGVAGLDVVDGQNVLIGETAADLAAQAARVLQDVALARRLSMEGRALAEHRYDWSIAARPLVELHERLGSGVR